MDISALEVRKNVDYFSNNVTWKVIFFAIKIRKNSPGAKMFIWTGQVDPIFLIIFFLKPNPFFWTKKIRTTFGFWISLVFFLSLSNYGPRSISTISGNELVGKPTVSQSSQPVVKISYRDVYTRISWDRSAYSNAFFMWGMFN